VENESMRCPTRTGWVSHTMGLPFLLALPPTSLKSFEDDN
jgi:hypothetical protein